MLYRYRHYSSKVQVRLRRIVERAQSFRDLYDLFYILFMLRRAFSHAAKMSSYTTDKASPFTRAVIAAMRKL